MDNCSKSNQVKICVPLCFEDEAAYDEHMPSVLSSGADIIEWRADIFEQWGNIESVLHMLSRIRRDLGNIPLIFTCRTVEEGGDAQCTGEYYRRLLSCVIVNGSCDFADIELSSGQSTVEALSLNASEAGTGTILSYHNFACTPPRREIDAKLSEMLLYSANMYKVAYMPLNKGDVMTVMHAGTDFTEAYPSKSLVTISMGALGLYSRIMAKLTGSPLTFASSGRASAPGQPSVAQLREAIELLEKISPV